MTMPHGWIPALSHVEGTCGSWATETESAQAFDAIIEGLELFRVHKEVEGKYLYLRPTQEDRTARIDRILTPRIELVRRGWTYGPIGVEIKKSGVKIGRPLCQLLDYSRATWRVGNLWLQPEWYFLWPMRRLSGALESIAANHQIGGANRDHYGNVVFHSTNNLATVGPNHIDIRPQNSNHGSKVGSR